MVSSQGGGIDPALVVAGLLALGAGIWTLRFTRGSLRRLAAMLRTETEPIADIESGLVEVEGTVVSAGEAVEGRMTGEEAVVTEYRRSQDRSGTPGDGESDPPDIPLPQQLVPTSFNRGAVPFYVEDESGRALVDAANADLSLGADAKRRSHGRETREVEARLEPGDEVYVIGNAVPAGEYTPEETDGGVLRLLLGFFLREHRRVPASAVMDDEENERELVITRRDGSEFLITDAAEWRGWIRQGLMVALWTLVSVLFIAVGGYLVLDGLVGLSLPF